MKPEKIIYKARSMGITTLAETIANKTAEIESAGLCHWDVRSEDETPAKCKATNRSGGYMSCVKPAGHIGNHEDVCGCWWRR